MSEERPFVPKHLQALYDALQEAKRDKILEAIHRGMGLRQSAVDERQKMEEQMKYLYHGGQRWCEVTQNNDQKIWVNVANALSVEKAGSAKSTIISYPGREIFCRELPEQVLGLFDQPPANSPAKPPQT